MAGAIVNRVRDAIMADMLAPHEIAQADPWLIARYEHTASVAIEAMREPTDAMLEAEMDTGGIGYDGECESAHPEEIWRAMIDAALAEKD